MNTKAFLLTLALGTLISTGVFAQEQPKFLGDRHVQRSITCDACHGSAVSKDLPLDADRHQPCVKCHGFYNEVVKKTQPANPEEMNPHSQHDGNLPCTTCHKGHQPGVNYCGKCHMYTFKVP